MTTSEVCLIHLLSLAVSVFQWTTDKRRKKKRREAEDGEEKGQQQQSKQGLLLCLSTCVCPVTSRVHECKAASDDQQAIIRQVSQGTDVGHV